MAPPEICSMRSSTPYPWTSPSEIALRMTTSRLPGRSSACRGTCSPMRDRRRVCSLSYPGKGSRGLRSMPSDLASPSGGRHLGSQVLLEERIHALPGVAHHEDPVEVVKFAGVHHEVH